MPAARVDSWPASTVAGSVVRGGPAAGVSATVRTPVTDPGSFDALDMIAPVGGCDVIEAGTCSVVTGSDVTPARTDPTPDSETDAGAVAALIDVGVAAG
jgi:hypothetical protein